MTETDPHIAKVFDCIVYVAVAVLGDDDNIERWDDVSFPATFTTEVDKVLVIESGSGRDGE